MSKIDHYMVDYLDADGAVQFANDRELEELSEAKAIASKTSKTCDTGAYVVAFVNGELPGQYRAVGHISFFDGKQSSTDGIVI